MARFVVECGWDGSGNVTRTQLVDISMFSMSGTPQASAPNSASAGLMPPISGSKEDFLRGDGTFANLEDRFSKLECAHKSLVLFFLSQGFDLPEDLLGDF